LFFSEEKAEARPAGTKGLFILSAGSRIQDLAGQGGFASFTPGWHDILAR
jgi:hypothetical protein